MMNGNSYVEFAQCELDKIIQHINPAVDTTTVEIGILGEYITATFQALPNLSLMIEAISDHVRINEAPIDHTTSQYKVSVSNL